MHPNVEKIGAIQRPGARGAAVVIDGNPLAAPDLDGSGAPVTFATTVDNLYRMLAAK
jgi:hypothetical protein